MDLNFLLRLVYIFLGLTFIIVGVYLILILIEVRQTLHRTNNIVGRVDSILDIVENKIIRPTANLASYLGIAKEVVGLVGSLRSAVSRPKEGKKHG